VTGKGSPLYVRIYRLVSMIPPGRVATYGQIARLVGGCSARSVGYAMASVGADSPVPWHRVINSRGRISIRSDGDPCDAQRQMLESEGIVFKGDGRVDLGVFGWEGPLREDIHEKG
jgi:methylated-DNA-protein-cysteine methyltransferase-like protein